MTLTKKEINYCALFLISALVVTIIYILFGKYIVKHIGKILNNEKTEKFNDPDVLETLYHDHVLAYDRSTGYETNATVTTTASITENLPESGMIQSPNKFRLTASNNHYYQLHLGDKPSVYGLVIKLSRVNPSATNHPKISVKHSLASLNNNAFMPLVDHNNNHFNLNTQVELSNDEPIKKNYYFAKPIQSKYIRLYTDAEVYINVDVITKPQHFFSLRPYIVSKAYALQEQTNMTIPNSTYYESKTFDVADEHYYLSNIDEDTPVKPYSDKLGKREIFDLDIRTPAFDFENLSVSNNAIFDAYILRTVRDSADMFCNINPDDKKMYCSSKATKSNNLLRFHVDTIGETTDKSHLHLEDTTNRKIVLIQDFKSGLYADNTFTFTVQNAVNAGKFIIERETKDTIKSIMNIDDYINKEEKEVDKNYKECQDKEIKYIILRRPYNDATLKREHTEALMNRNGQLPKKIIISNSTSQPPEGIYIAKPDSNVRNIKFIVKKIDGTGEVANSYYQYKLWTDGQTYGGTSTNTTDTTDNEKYGPHCSLANFTDDPKYIYHSTIINVIDSASSTNVNNEIIFNNKTDTYKPELYEGYRISHSSSGEEGYISDIKKHVPTSHKSYTPEIIKVCLPENMFNSAGNIIPFKLKTTVFDVVDSDGISKPTIFEVTNEHVLSTRCRDSTKVNTMYKINPMSKTHDRFAGPHRLSNTRTTTAHTAITNAQGTSINEVFEIVSPDSKEFKKIECGCNCLQNINQIQNYRKSNNFVKSILNNLMQKTDDVLAKRNKEITEVEVEEKSLLEQQHVKDYGDHASSYLMDTNKFVKTDEIRNYYQVKGHEGFNDTIKLTSDLETLKNEFYGMYKIFNGQFLMFEDTYLQIDQDFIGFIRNKTPIFKFKHDHIMPFYSPYQNSNGIKTRIIAKDKMVHSIENANMETLFENIGLTIPNFIYISRYDYKTDDGIIKQYYKLSNREYTTIMQMEKV